LATAVLDSRGDPPLAGHADAALRAIGIASVVAAAAVSLASRGRLPTRAELRTLLGWAGVFLGQSQVWLGKQARVGVSVGWSLAMLAWAAWAWLAPSVKQRTPWARRGWWLLAALLAAAALVPWVSFPWLAREG
jgi:hypothetical protein